MAIEPRTLSEMVASSRLETAKLAIVAKFKELLKGLTIEALPGKLDINDVVAKAVMPAPGVAVGWTRIRAPRDPDGGTFGAVVEWAAYIFAEPAAVAGRRVDRETIAHGIAAFVLDILADPDVSSWGLADVSPTLPDPAPQFTPVLTMKAYEGGVGCYAVTWSQILMDCGASLFDGVGDVTATPVDGGAEFDGMPRELVDALGGSEPE